MAPHSTLETGQSKGKTIQTCCNGFPSPLDGDHTITITRVRMLIGNDTVLHKSNMFTPPQMSLAPRRAFGPPPICLNLTPVKK